ncbi:D-2-hydroxyacid dehydrogenase [Nakamurella sp. PAMC28650]|uniref:D-2-hydroxyacid dehydrogenase n=1 Tax=Nakamurella sp. PAMC28650 TaxID=2762325 RepID=UPI00164E80D2|nr:D-2-hydroxyacid dehydrogenase [Nakamurella sp. PAMC28650]QNK83539.1 D-2-hydroxyacid dehydrogenase [Nakamurella sp. PAMC28650]
MSHPKILISTYLEPEYVQQIAAAVACEVLYEPELLPVNRYGNDHGGIRPVLTPEQDARWSSMLAAADIAFDFDWRAPAELLTSAPNLRWVQATSAGIGGFVQRYRLDAGELILTTAAGTHAAPLAEFAVAGAMHFVKDVPGLLSAQRGHQWERHVSGQLSGRRATVVGLGSIGRRVAELYSMLGVRVTGVGRPGGTYDIPGPVISTDDLDAVLPDTEILVLACPLTPETDNLINAERVGLLPAGAIVVNIARGQVIDEPALTAALTSGHLSGAALDVFAVEPLPGASPLWDLPNVLVSPHSASTAADENAVLTDLFIDNLHRYLAGEPLRNVYRADRGY